MGFDEIKGQMRAVELLRSGLQTGRIAHAYIFYGPFGVGKNKTASIFAQALNCLNPKGANPCDTCSSCYKIKNGAHPDIIKISPEGTSIKTAQIRDLQEKASYKCYEGLFKVIMIDNAELLTPEAANCLLKTLEEPTEKSVFILLAEDTGKLPPTIISRCQMIPFGFLDDNLIQDILRKEGITNNFLPGLSRGSAGKALQMAKDPQSRQMVADVEKLLNDLHSHGYKKVFEWAEVLEKDKQQVENILEILQLYYRDQIVVAVGGEDNRLLDMLPVKDYRIEECYTALSKLSEALGQIKGNAGIRLVLEVLFIELIKIEQRK